MFRLQSIQVNFGQNQVLNSSLPLSLKTRNSALVVGETGSGKSTFLGAVSGLVPRFTGGELRANGSLDDLDLFDVSRKFNPADIGFVFQNPFDGFVQSTVRAEVLFSAKITQSPLIADSNWLARILQSTNIAHLADRNLDTLSDGEAQRVAIAAALFLQPKILLLDEPTSALDLDSARKLRDLLKELQAEFNFMLVLSEHRYDLWLEYVDKVWLIQSSEIIEFTPAVFARDSGLPILNREVLRELQISSLEWEFQNCQDLISQIQLPEFISSPIKQKSPTAISAVDLRLEINKNEILKNISFEISAGAVCAVLGPSGAGKTSLLHALAGDFELANQPILINQLNPQNLTAKDLLGNIALVPQQPGNLFVSETVSGECELADRWRGLTPGTTLQLLNRFKLETDLDLHPRDLSAGAQLWLALAIAIAANPKVLILDEPTRGLDTRGKKLLFELIQDRRNAGLTTIWATHDVELAAGISDDLIYLEGGEMVSFGPPTAEMHPALASLSPTHELLGHDSYLSLEQLRRSSASIK